MDRASDQIALERYTQESTVTYGFEGGIGYLRTYGHNTIVLAQSFRSHSYIFRLLHASNFEHSTDTRYFGEVASEPTPIGTMGRNLTCTSKFSHTLTGYRASTCTAIPSQSIHRLTLFKFEDSTSRRQSGTFQTRLKVTSPAKIPMGGK